MMETYFHGAEVLILLFGVALPMIRSSQRLKNILQDYPPHKHVKDLILYPKGFEPTGMETLYDRANGKGNGVVGGNTGR